MLWRIDKRMAKHVISLSLLALTTTLGLPINSANAAIVYSFTTAGATGATGPIQSQLNTAYAGTTLANNVTESSSVGIQLWTVPTSGNYTIAAAGAKGGDGSGTTGGAGAIMQGDFTLVQGQVLAILVGQMGTSNTNYLGGGGGGTFVTKPSVADSSSVFVIAGGGGGGPRYSANLNSNINAVASDPAQQGSSSASTLLTNRGSNGSGGGAGDAGSGGGGGGLLTSGGSQTSSPSSAGAGVGGFSYVLGGKAAALKTFSGGFGGGGSGDWQTWAGSGGGGGYSGGGGGAGTTGSGGGGSSLNRGVNQVNTAGANSGAGYVTITFNYAILGGAISLSMQSGGNSFIYNTSTNIVANINQAGKVTFYQSGKPISNCRNLSGTSSVTCSWKPAVHGGVTLTAFFQPTGLGAASAYSAPLVVGAAKRINNR